MAFFEKNILYIPLGEEDAVIKVIQRVNESYKSAFKFKGTQGFDGVEFALVEINDSPIEAVFYLGYFYGWRAEEEQLKKNPNWW